MRVSDENAPSGCGAARHSRFRWRVILVGFAISLLLFAPREVFAAGNQCSDVEHAAQRTLVENIDCLKEKRFGGSNNADIVLWSIFKVFLVGLVVGLLFRIAGVKQNARFVHHLALAMLLFLCTILVSVVSLFMIDRLASEALIGGSQNVDALVSARKVIQKFERTSEGLNIIGSFITTFWMALTAFLILRYPRQALPREFVVVSMAILGAAAGSVAVVTTAFQDQAVPLLEVLDAVTSATAIVCVGWALLRMPARKNLYLFQCSLCFLYTIWGVGQLGYWLLESTFLYQIVLFVLGYSSALITLIFSAFALADKPEYAAA